MSNNAQDGRYVKLSAQAIQNATTYYLDEDQLQDFVGDNDQLRDYYGMAPTDCDVDGS